MNGRLSIFLTVLFVSVSGAVAQNIDAVSSGDTVKFFPSSKWWIGSDKGFTFLDGTLQTTAGVDPSTLGSMAYGDSVLWLAKLSLKAPLASPTFTGVVHTPAITGAVTDSGGQVYNVKVFGAVGDGVTDDAEAFQTALDTIKARGGGNLFVPEGEFLIESVQASQAALRFEAGSNLTISGTGAGSKIILSASFTGLSADNAFLLISNSDDIVIRDVYFDGQGSQRSDTLTNIELRLNKNVQLERVYSTDASNGHCIAVWGDSNVVISKSYVWGTKVNSNGHGIDVDLSGSTASQDVVLDKNFIWDIWGVQKVENVNNLTFTNNYITAYSGRPVVVFGSNAGATAEVAHTNWLIENNRFFDGTQIQFNNPLNNDMRIRFLNNYCEGKVISDVAAIPLKIDIIGNTFIHGLGGNANTIHISMADSSIVSFKDNKVFYTPASRYGLIVTGRHWIVEDNYFEPTYSGVRVDSATATIVHNEIKASAGTTGIELSASGDTTNIVNNEISGFTNGVLIASGSVGNRLLWNNLSANTNRIVDNNSSPKPTLIIESESDTLNITGDVNITGDIISPVVISSTKPNLRIQDSETNSSGKIGRIVGKHYTNAEEDVMFGEVEASSGNNIVRLGGGTSLTNAATKVQHYTGANTTTVTGTLRLETDATGLTWMQYFRVGAANSATYAKIDSAKVDADTLKFYVGGSAYKAVK